MKIKVIHVLLLEDNPGDVRLFREFLHENGLVEVELDHVEWLKNGLEHLTQGKPDVILLDLGLPDSQGLETFTRVYAQAPDVPIVVLTGLNDAEQAVEAVKAGAQDYLVKEEVCGGLLVRAVRYAIERKRAEQEILKLNAELEIRVEERTRELREAQEQLIRQEKLAVLGQLAGGVGHELRNPLAVINNAVYYLKLVQSEADEKVKEYLGMIEKETHTAEKIITDLLDFARIKSVDREPAAVSELVQRVLERYPAPASVAVALDFPAGLPKVYVDPRQMEQVLGNLVVNACQAMASAGSAGTPEGGKLTIAAHRQEQMVILAVKDTGTGIPPENIKKLFEPLFTTKLKGIGLGLVVSRKLTEANGGRIEVESAPGVGSTFTLYLPVSAE